MHVSTHNYKRTYTHSHTHTHTLTHSCTSQSIIFAAIYYKTLFHIVIYFASVAVTLCTLL